MLTVRLVRHPGVCVDTMACKELEFVLTLRLVRHLGVYADTVFM